MRSHLLLLLIPLASARGDDPAPLPGTKPLTESGDLASKMIDGIDRFLLRKIDEAAAKRDAFWDREAEDPEARISANEPNRGAWATSSACQAGGRARVSMEVLSTPRTGPAIAEDDTVRVVAVRWQVAHELYGEGLLLIPRGRTRTGPTSSRSPIRPDARDALRAGAGRAGGVAVPPAAGPQRLPGAGPGADRSRDGQ